MPDLALLANVLPRVISILNANPGVWGSTVSGNVGAFPTDSEIAAAVIEADGSLITRGYFNSINNSLAERFMSMSSPMAKGAAVPEHYGNIGKVELSKRVLAPTLVTNATDLFTVVDIIPTSSDGKPVTFLAATGGALPTGITAGTTYYMARLSSTTFKVCASISDWSAGIVVNITSDGTLPFFVIEWQDGVETDASDDIKAAIAEMVDYVGESEAYSYLYAIENNVLYHATNWARIQVPTYTRTTVLQANKADEPIIISEAIALLAKHSSPALFADYSARAQRGIDAIIRDGSYQPTNPDQNM